MPLAKCKRCAGTGKIAVRFSLPGADRHGSYIDTEWDGPTRYRECVKCMATGWGKPDYLPNAGVIVRFDERLRPHRTDMKENQWATTTPPSNFLTWPDGSVQKGKGST